MTACPSHATPWLLQVAIVLVALTGIASAVLIRLKRRAGWILSFWNQIPLSITHLLLGAWPYVILNLVLAWNAARGIVEWKKPTL